MSAPNVELLDYNWGYRKLAVANVKIAELEAQVAEQKATIAEMKDRLRIVGNSPLNAGLSGSGVNIFGDRASIDKVKAWMHGADRSEQLSQIIVQERAEAKKECEQQEAVISQMRAAVEMRFNEKIHSFKTDEFRNYCYCGYYESHPIHTFAALGKQENDSAK